MQKTKSKEQNTQSHIFSAPKMPQKIQNSFLKRAKLPLIYDTGFQMRGFDMIYQKNLFIEGLIGMKN